MSLLPVTGILLLYFVLLEILFDHLNVDFSLKGGINFPTDDLRLERVIPHEYHTLSVQLSPTTKQLQLTGADIFLPSQHPFKLAN